MVVPTPPVPLQDHCSIIYDGVLYTYQANAFQSLPLRNGAAWSNLPMGVPTNGSTCVQGSYNNDDALIIVGGSTSASNYTGIQSYSFSAKKWTSQTPLDAVAMERVEHGTAYLQQSSSILMYAGTQNNVYGRSSQTFLIGMTSPYNVQAFNSIAPPVVSPLVLPFNTTHALMLGGDPMNTMLFTFGPQDGWHQLDVSLQDGLRDSSMVQATILDGDDGSKVLEIFDFSTSPNQISTLLLQNATKTSSTHKRAYTRSAHHPAKRRKRDSTLGDRPAYNSTLAPQQTRKGYALAEDSKSGLIVASGGNSQDPLAIFNQTGNQWIDPNRFFDNQPASSSTSPTPTAAATGTPASSSASPSDQAANTHVRNKSLSILGGVLGGVFGLAALLIILLLLLRYCRRRRAKKREQQANSYALEDKAEMDFRDVGAAFMKEAGGNFDERGHGRNKSNKSGTSVHTHVKAPERGGAASSQSKRALLHHQGESAGSAHSFWGRKSPDKSPPTISAPIMGPPIGETLRTSPGTRSDLRADTSWSRYFDPPNSKELNSIPLEHDRETRPQTYFSGESEYNSSNPHESAEVEPLNVRASQNPLLYPPNIRVRSPTGVPRPRQGPAITHGARPDRRDEPPSPSTLVSDIDEEDEYARHSHSDGQESWTPVASIGERGSSWTEDRPASDYASSRAVPDNTVPVDSRVNSKIYPHPGERVRIPNFPTVPNSQVPSGVNTPTSPKDDPSKAPKKVAAQDFAVTAGGRRIPNNASVATYSAPEVGGHAMPENRIGKLPEYGITQARMFPRKQGELGPKGRGGRDSEDMSWLNLGTSAEQNNNHLRYAS